MGGIFDDLDLDAIKQEGKTIESVLAERLLAAGDQLRETSIGDPIEEAKLLARLSNSLISLSFPREAVALSEEAVAKLPSNAEQADTLFDDVQGQLARAYLEAGRHEDAVRLLQKLRAGNVESLGESHERTLAGTQSLIIALTISQRIDEAKKVSERAVELHRRKYGKEDPQTLDAMMVHADVLRMDGQLEEAVALLEFAIPRRERTLAENSPRGLNQLNALAVAYTNAGRRREAVRILEDCLKRGEARLGRRHMITLQTAENLATAYGDLGYLFLASKLQRDLWRQFEDRLGRNHWRTIISLANVGIHAANVIGADPPTTESLNDPDVRRDLQETADLLTEASSRAAAALSEDHPLTSVTRLDLAVVHHALGNHRQVVEAVEMIRDQSRLHKVNFGYLAESYAKLNRYEGGAEITRRDTKFARATLPNGSKQLAARLRQNAKLMLLLGSLDEAEDYARQATSIRQRVQANDWWFFEAKCLLGEVLLRQAKDASEESEERETLLKESRQLLELGVDEILKQGHLIYGDNHYDVPRRYVQCLAECLLLSKEKEAAAKTQRNATALAVRAKFQGRAATVDELKALFNGESNGDAEVRQTVLDQVRAEQKRLETFVALFSERLSRSQTPSGLMQRSLFHARLQDWKGAANDQLAAAQMLPADRSRMFWLRGALYRYLQGDLKTYQEACRNFAEAMNGTDVAAQAESVVKVNLLTPTPTAELEQHLTVVNQAMVKAEPDWFYPWGASTLALLEYRRANWKKAIAWTDRTDWFQKQPATISLVVRAMTLWKQGRNDEAERTLKRAEARIPRDLRSFRPGLEASHIVSLVDIQTDWLFAEALRREARALLAGESPEQHMAAWFKAEHSSGSTPNKTIPAISK